MDKNLSFLKFALVTFFCIFLSCQSFSQIDSLVIGKKYKITLNYGFEATGIVKNITDDTVKIETEYKTFSLPRKDIAEINGMSIKVLDNDTTHLLNEQIEAPGFAPDPNESRLFLGPSGKTLNAGKFYLSCASFFPWITIPFFFPFGSAGITDYFNVGVGASPYPPLFYIAPKIRAYQLDNVNVSLGFIYAQTYEFQNVHTDYNLGFIYGVSTFDFSKIYSFSIGTGLWYNVDWHYKTNIYTYGSPLLMLGFEARTDKNFKFISENWIDFGSKRGVNISVLSAGGRYFNGGFAIDFSIVGVLTDATFDGPGKFYIIPIPWLSFAYNFGL